MKVYVVEGVFIRHAHDDLDIERISEGYFKEYEDAKNALDKMYEEIKNDIEEDLDVNIKRDQDFYIHFYDDCCGDNNIYKAEIVRYDCKEEK